MAYVPQEAKFHQGGRLVVSTIPLLDLVKGEIPVSFDSTGPTPGMDTSAGHAPDTSFCLFTLLTNSPLSQLLPFQNDVEILCSPGQPLSDKVILALQGIFNDGPFQNESTNLGVLSGLGGIICIIAVRVRDVKRVREVREVEILGGCHGSWSSWSGRPTARREVLVPSIHFFVCELSSSGLGGLESVQRTSTRGFLEDFGPSSMHAPQDQYETWVMLWMYNFHL